MCIAQKQSQGNLKVTFRRSWFVVSPVGLFCSQEMERRHLRGCPSTSQIETKSTVHPMSPCRGLIIGIHIISNSIRQLFKIINCDWPTLFTHFLSVSYMSPWFTQDLQPCHAILQGKWEGSLVHGPFPPTHTFINMFCRTKRDERDENSTIYTYKTKRYVCLSACFLFVCLHSPLKLLDGSGPNLACTSPWKLGMSSTYSLGGTPTKGGYNFGKTQNFENFLLLLWKKYFNYSNSNSNTINGEKDPVLEGKSLE